MISLLVYGKNNIISCAGSLGESLLTFRLTSLVCDGQQMSSFAASSTGAQKARIPGCCEGAV